MCESSVSEGVGLHKNQIGFRLPPQVRRGGTNSRMLAWPCEVRSCTTLPARPPVWPVPPGRMLLNPVMQLSLELGLLLGVRVQQVTNQERLLSFMSGVKDGVAECFKENTLVINHLDQSVVSP